MQVTELNSGEKAVHGLNGTVLTIEVKDQAVEIDLAAKQKDNKNVIDICLDREGNLVESIDKWHVANIIIPAASYSLVDTGEVDDEGNPVYEKVKDPLNTDNVKLDLWALPNFIKETNEGVMQ